MVGLISLLSLIANWQGAKNGLLFSQPNADIYNIDVTEQHPKTIDTALKHCETYGRYAAKSVCAVHTSAAFREACQFVDRFYQLRENGENGRKFVILDSGCGKGMSTVCLASLYPDIPVIGIDRSITRLSSNKKIEIRTNRSPLDSCKIKPFVQGSPGNASLIADALIDSRELLGNGDVGSHESKSKSKQNQVGSTEDSVMITCESNNNLVSCQKTSDKTVFDGNTTASSKLIESGIINDDKRKGGNIGESCYKTDDDNVDDDDDDYDNDNDNENENGKEDRASERNEENSSIQLRDNALLLRAELSDFFTLVAYQSDWVVHSHYLLYPNPYPKSKHLKRRWHGHPIFPVLLALGELSDTLDEDAGKRRF